MSQRKAEFALTLLVLVNSTAFLFTKMGIGGIQPMELVSVRMLIAFAPLAILFLPRLAHVNRATLSTAAVLGAIICGSMALQAYGLYTLTSSEGAFLASTTVVWVPIVVAVLARRLPARSVVISALLTIVGIALMCGIGSGGASSGITPGTIMYLLGAVLYAAHIIVVDRAGDEVDILAATILEMFFAGVVALVASLAFETPQLPSDPTTWGALLALGLFTTAIGFGFQPLVQTHTTAERYGVLFGLSPLFATLLGVAVLGETMLPIAILGGMLVLAGVMVSELAGTALVEKPVRALMSYAPLGALMRSRHLERF